MTQDNHFAGVRKLVEREFADGDDKIQLTVTEFHGEKTVEIGVTNRYWDTAGVDFKAGSPMLIEFAAALQEVVKIR